ncbi:MAG TPA: dihydropteroate synthase [Bacteroidales bacterium]|nr:dihydropteroate synthase [Bacteroidales bacterium]HOK74378.1 dihydropteroate synthase [Bacteroidales bacterium]HOM41205.1 dihydropteroate synthase [Bacteroidales bacterium]HOU29640.1 dihydropteroate synthase [Bacteroidales bacterium]HPP92966.1 dihydropteroate synthase [Bacteroidales bacterium]
MLKKSEYINTGGKLIDLKIPRIMGIINVTPDSFYTGSRYFDDKSILEAASRMLDEGADFIDVGGYSSRPGAEDITPEEEKSRVLRAIKLITREIPEAIVSVDTFRAEIAYEAVMECGAKIINDISGGEADKEMFNVVAELNVPYILMHMQGTPRTMQINPAYNDVVADILMWFGERIFKLRTMGVKDIILDPGFGFGKTVEHNYELLRRLGEFKIAGLPIMAGLSRKSMIWKTLDVKPEDALNGTTALNMAALMNGADILRVHDVKEAVQVRTLYLKLRLINKEG